MADEQTLKFYADEARRYVGHERKSMAARLDAFLEALPAGGRVLELGTGGGDDAAYMLARGLAVEPSDASPELAALAGERLGVPVAILRFDQLDAEGRYDGIWANAALLHAPRAELTDDLARILRALKPGGLLVASFKAGDAEGRDGFGRYYNYLDREALRGHLQAAGTWTSLEFSEADGGGYDNQPTRWLWVTARR